MKNNIKHPHFRHKLENYIQGLIAKKFTLKQVSVYTGYTIQHLSRLKKRYEKEGSKALINGHKGIKPINAISQKKRRQIIRLYKSFQKSGIKELNFRFFRKIVERLLNIKLSYKTVYNILKSEGIKSPDAHRKERKAIHSLRFRREKEGEMIQVDATPFQWFLWCKDNTYYTLHGAIDDATGKIVGLYMTEHECSYGYYDVLEQTLKKYGVPKEIYSDKAAIFCVTPRNKQNLTIIEQLRGIHEKKTHFQRILNTFGIKQLLAWSPQAKGKVERMWRTIQGRLPWYFCFYGIKTVEEANKFLKEIFIKEFNDEFAMESKNGSVWKEAPSDFRDKICSRYDRVADRKGKISFDCCDFKISGKVCAKAKVEVCLFRDRIAVCVNGEMRSLTLVSDINNMNDALPEEQKEIIKKYLLSDAKKVCA